MTLDELPLAPSVGLLKNGQILSLFLGQYIELTELQQGEILSRN